MCTRTHARTAPKTKPQRCTPRVGSFRGRLIPRKGNLADGRRVVWCCDSPSVHLSGDGAGALDGLIALAAPVVAALAHVRPPGLALPAAAASEPALYDSAACAGSRASRVCGGRGRRTCFVQNQAGHLVCQAARSSLAGSTPHLFEQLAAFIVPLLPAPARLPEPSEPPADMDWHNVSFLAHVDKVRGRPGRALPCAARLGHGRSMAARCRCCTTSSKTM
jgi:hypothetical protein